MAGLQIAMRRAGCAALAVGLLLNTARAEEDPPELATAYEQIRKAPDKDRTLYQMQAGVIALDRGYRAEAARLFDAVLVNISAIYANNEQAARARSLWYEEGTKDFKGEPYERAMAHYYRGLLDLFGGDYDNARASFRGGLLQDAFAEEAQNRADFASLVFLEGWCSQLMGMASSAEESYAEFRALRPGFATPAADHNLLVLVETGYGPRKRADNVAGNSLRYFPNPRSFEKRAAIVFGNTRFPLSPVEDLYWQASTRGGRPIDRVIDGKMEFKAATGNVGSALTTIGSVAQEYSPLFDANIGGAVAAVSAVGTAAQLMSFSTKARADARYWNNLPEGLHVFTVRRPPSLTALTIEFSDAAGQVDPSLTRTIPIQVDARGNGVAWLRSRPAQP